MIVALLPEHKNRERGKRYRGLREKLLKFWLNHHVGGREYQELQRDPNGEEFAIGTLQGLKTCVTFKRHYVYGPVTHKVCSGTFRNSWLMFQVFVQSRGRNGNLELLEPTLDSVLENIRLFRAPQLLTV